jgi:hypothetical protein
MRPLFQGIVFVQGWRGWPKYWINGVVRLMSRNGGLVQVSDLDIQIMMDRERRREFDQVLYGPGGAVIRDDLIIGGEYQVELFGNRIMASLEELSSSGKATVRDLLGIKWTVPVEQLEAPPPIAAG